MFYEYSWGSRAYLDRARKHLRKFEEEGDVPSFFYAALELRFGIEARVTEYLRPAMEKHGKKIEQESEYVASKLLKKLAGLEPSASSRAKLAISPEQHGTPRTTVFHYTPVTQELAGIHGRLGGLLHYQFFLKNPLWALKKALEPPAATLLNHVEVLKRGIELLTTATTGTLLSIPEFWEPLLNEVLAEPS